MTTAQIAYLAGILDGEGSLSLYWRFARDHTKKYITPTLQVTNTNRRLMDWLVEHLGGAVYPQKEIRANRKPSWHWSLSGEKARRVVRMVRRHLLLKTAQADVILAFKPKSSKRDSLGRVIATISEADYADRVAAIDTIRRLNRRGPVLPQ